MKFLLLFSLLIFWTNLAEAELKSSQQEDENDFFSLNDTFNTLKNSIDNLYQQSFSHTLIVRYFSCEPVLTKTDQVNESTISFKEITGLMMSLDPQINSYQDYFNNILKILRFVTNQCESRRNSFYCQCLFKRDTSEVRFYWKAVEAYQNLIKNETLIKNLIQVSSDLENLNQKKFDGFPMSLKYTFGIENLLFLNEFLFLLNETTCFKPIDEFQKEYALCKERFIGEKFEFYEKNNSIGQNHNFLKCITRFVINEPNLSACTEMHRFFYFYQVFFTGNHQVLTNLKYLDQVRIFRL